MQGVTIADVDNNSGGKAVKEIEDLFGKNKAIFVKTDVSLWQEFEGKLVEEFINCPRLVHIILIASGDT